MIKQNLRNFVYKNMNEIIEILSNRYAVYKRADPLIKEGTWINFGEDGCMYKCSLCNKTVYSRSGDTVPDSCPVCEALLLMGEGEDE